MTYDRGTRGRFSGRVKSDEALANPAHGPHELFFTSKRLRPADNFPVFRLAILVITCRSYLSPTIFQGKTNVPWREYLLDRVPSTCSTAKKSGSQFGYSIFNNVRIFIENGNLLYALIAIDHVGVALEYM